MELSINSDEGLLKLGAFSVSWGNYIEECDMPGFACFSWRSYSLEVGEIDQGCPGFYITKIEDSTPITVITLLQLKSTHQ